MFMPLNGLIGIINKDANVVNKKIANEHTIVVVLLNFVCSIDVISTLINVYIRIL